MINSLITQSKNFIWKGILAIMCAIMSNPLIMDIRKQLCKSVASVLPGSSIIAVYVFGSALKKSLRKDSDIDIAFLLDEKAYKAEPVRAIAPAYLAATEAGRVLDRKTDVLILNGASLEIAYEIITTGECVFETDVEKRLNYEIALKGMYFDFRPFLDELRSNCIKGL